MLLLFILLLFKQIIKHTRSRFTRRGNKKMAKGARKLLQISLKILKTPILKTLSYSENTRVQ